MDKTLEAIHKKAKKKDNMPDQSNYLKLAKRNDKGRMVGLGPTRVRVLKIAKEPKTPYKFTELMDHLVLYLDVNGKRKKYEKPVMKWKETKDGKRVVISEADREVHYFVANLINLDVDVGDELILEYKSKSNSFMGFIDIKKVEDVEDNIPIIEEDEPSTTEYRTEQLPNSDPSGPGAF